MSIIRFLILVLSFFGCMDACRCEKCSVNIPFELQVPPFEHLNEYTTYNEILGKLEESDGEEFQRVLKSHVKVNNNAAGSCFTFPDGFVREIYRSSHLAESPEGLRELIQERGVGTLINLHQTDKFDMRPWTEKEKDHFYTFGGKEYIHVTDFNYRFRYVPEKQLAIDKIVHIVNLIKAGKGNVLIHCMGGEHKSGIVFAVLRRCFQNVPIEAIIQEYKCHCGWVSDEQPGGFNPKYVELFTKFPVELVLN